MRPSKSAAVLALLRTVGALGLSAVMLLVGLGFIDDSSAQDTLKFVAEALQDAQRPIGMTELGKGAATPARKGVASAAAATDR